MKYPLLFSFCLTCILSACTHTASVNHGALDPAQIQIAQAATSVSQSLTKLAAVEAAVTPPLTRKHLTAPDTAGMHGTVSVDWSGPVGDLVKQIATMTHYHLRVLGTPPAIPVLISINATHTPVADILRDADFQAGKRANIIVYPRTHVIELRYAHA